MLSTPETQLSSGDVDAVVQAAGHAASATSKGQSQIRRPQDTLAEIESIEQIIHDAESDQADTFNIPEHPAVSLIGDDSRVRTSAQSFQCRTLTGFNRSTRLNITVNQPPSLNHWWNMACD